MSLSTTAVPGVTEKESITDWEAPFQPFDPKRIRNPDHPGPGNDEDYWDRYGTTPKAFVSLAAGRRLWGSRFGDTTTVRVARGEKGPSPEELGQELNQGRAELVAGRFACNERNLHQRMIPRSDAFRNSTIGRISAESMAIFSSLAMASSSGRLSR